MGGGGPGAFGSGSGGQVSVAIETLQETKARMQAETMAEVPGSVSYLEWDGRGIPGQDGPAQAAARPGIPGSGPSAEQGTNDGVTGRPDTGDGTTR